MNAEAPKETYLGDGLYVSIDGYHIVLRAPKRDGDHTVCLEPEVAVNFLRFIADNDGFGLGAMTMKGIAEKALEEVEKRRKSTA